MDVQAQVLLDSNGQDLAVRHTQDCEPILEWAKEARREEQHCDWGREIAEIPDVKLVELLDEEHRRGNVGFRLFSKECDDLIHKKLYNGDWAYLRTDKPALISGWLGFGS